MGDTGPPYNLRYPELVDPPNIPLDMQELATDVHTELDRIENRDRGWVPIGGLNTESLVSNFLIDFTNSGEFPAGTFSRLRLTMVGNMTGASARSLVNGRVNSDGTVGLYRSARIAQNPNVGFDSDDTEYNDAGNSWRLGVWSSVQNMLQIELLDTNVSSVVNYFGTSTRSSSTITAHQHYTTHGQLLSNLLIDSLQIITEAGKEYNEVRYWIEGYETATV